MTIHQTLQAATARLHTVGIGTARLDALILLEHVTGIDRAQLLAAPERELSTELQNVFEGLVVRRLAHEPIAYLLGKTEFYGREFIISPSVLEPRPESETIIDLLKSALRDEATAAELHARLTTRPATPQQTPPESATHGLRQPQIRIADVGTGSGALGITAILELKNAQVDLLEIDAEAIKVAKSNVIKFATGQEVIHTDLLQPLADNAHASRAPAAAALLPYDILLCNLPYVPDAFEINPAAMREPKIAIFGGTDGLDPYRRLFEQLQNIAYRPLLILTEALPPQHEALSRIAAASGYEQRVEEDFVQLFYGT